MTLGIFHPFNLSKFLFVILLLNYFFTILQNLNQYLMILYSMNLFCVSDKIFNTIKKIFIAASLSAHKSLFNLSTFVAFVCFIKKSAALTKSVVVHTDSVTDKFLQLANNLVTILTLKLILFMSFKIVFCKLKKMFKIQSTNIAWEIH